MLPPWGRGVGSELWSQNRPHCPAVGEMCCKPVAGAGSVCAASSWVGVYHWGGVRGPGEGSDSCWVCLSPWLGAPALLWGVTAWVPPWAWCKQASPQRQAALIPFPHKREHSSHKTLVSVTRNNIPSLPMLENCRRLVTDGPGGGFRWLWWMCSNPPR